MTTTHQSKQQQAPNPDQHRYLLTTLILILCIKVLLIPSYRSTDFDVHRNWLSITRSIPLTEWYFDDYDGQTVHTLDYPPLFAMFEAVLSRNFFTNWLLKRGYLDERCLDRLADGDNLVSDACIAFHRCTVILSDVVFIFGAYFASIQCLKNQSWKNAVLTFLLIVTNPGILVLDHVHFQYNGMLLGILLLSIGFVARGGWLGNIFGAIFYAVLVTMKHLYLPLAPLYFIYMLRHFCYNPRNATFSFTKFFVLALVTVTTLLSPFLPFILQSPCPQDQLKQMFHRLFPFQRGLCHDYWAGNVWAMYLFIEKCISFVNKKIPMGLDALPEVTPKVAAFMLLLSLLPAVFAAWRSATSSEGKAIMNGKMNGSYPNKNTTNQSNLFVHGLVYSSLSTFMLAYHVHEKAIMTAIIPMTLLIATSPQYSLFYLRISALGHFGLLPLLHRKVELLFKITLYVLHLLTTKFVLENIHGKRIKTTALDYLGFGSLLSIFFFAEVIHPMYVFPKMEFFPLMMISIACSIGLIICWIHSLIFMLDNSVESSSSVERNDESSEMKKALNGHAVKSK